MANTVTTQIIIDGPQNTVVKIVGVIDTADIANTTLIDPALLSGMDPWGNKATKLRIKRVFFDIEDLLDVRLSWDATTPVLINTFTGRGNIDATTYGGLQNNAGAGITGKILYSTQGWVASAILEFTLILELGKQ